MVGMHGVAGHGVAGHEIVLPKLTDHLVSGQRDSLQCKLQSVPVNLHNILNTGNVACE